MMKKILALCTSVILLLGMFSVCGIVLAAGDSTAVYVDFASGNDANAGTQEAPLKTLVAAFNKVNTLGLTGEARRVHAMGSYTDVSVTMDLTGVNAYTENITITADPGKTIWLSGAEIKLGGPVTLDALIGKMWNEALTIYTYGYDLTLGENFADNYYGKRSEGTIIYAGFDYATQAANTATSNGRYQLGRDNNLIIKGSKPGVATIYYGNKAEYNGTYIPVQYGDGKLVIDNPNLTVATLKIGNSTSKANNDTTSVSGAKYESLANFNSLKIKVDNVASINSMSVNSHQGSVATGSVQAIFNNGTYAKIAVTNNFGWSNSDWTTDGFLTSNAYVLKTGAGDAVLDFTDTVGTFAVTEGYTAIVGGMVSANGKLTAPKGINTVTFTGGPTTATTTTSTTTTTKVTGSSNVTTPTGNGGTQTTASTKATTTTTTTVPTTRVTGVFVDAANGSDNNKGTDEAAPMKSIGAAVNRINQLGFTGADRLITVTNCPWDGASLNLAGCLPYDEMITIRSALAGSTIWLNDSTIQLVGPLTINSWYACSATQAACTIKTNGYELVLGPLAWDAKAYERGTETVIYAGYDPSFEALTTNSFSGFLEFKRDINITVLSEKEGKISVFLGNYSNPGNVVQYKDVNILLDSAKTTVTRLFMGNHGVYGNRMEQMNQFKTINLIVNNIKAITAINGATYQNGVKVQNLQMIYNNNTSTVVSDNLIYGAYFETNLLADKKWILRGVANSGGTYIMPGKEAGAFRVVGAQTATAKDATNTGKTYTSVNGVLTVPHGTHTVSYSALNGFTVKDGVLTATQTFTGKDLRNVVPAQDGDLLFIGWKNAGGTFVANAASVSLNAGETLTAVYVPFDVGYADGAAFYVEGVQVRVKGTQALRFIVRKDTGFEEAFSSVSGVKYGFLLLPQTALDAGQTLTVNNSNAINGNNVDKKDFVYFTYDKSAYTVCITDIPQERYDASYVACGYVTYTDKNGCTQTAYSEPLACSLFEAASLTLLEDDARSASDAKKLTATQRARLKTVMDTFLEDDRTTAQNQVNTVPDTVGSTATGTVYYVSPSGSDSNPGTKSKPWKTVDHLNSVSLKAGDVVLFERGGTYRVAAENGVHKPIRMVSGVSYGAYGTGDKPKIYGSIQNYMTATWTATSYANVYRVTFPYSLDAGLLAITDKNGNTMYGAPKKAKSYLKQDWDFYFEKGVGVHVYCSKGNPGQLSSLYSSIEIGVNESIFLGAGSTDIVIENLDFRYTGRHGVRFSNSKRITVRGCVFAYIGGSRESTTSWTRLGNGAEFMESSEDTLIEKCYFTHIYDSGATFQGGSAAGSTMRVKNFVLQDNYFEYCGMGAFEHWMGTGGRAESVVVRNNYSCNIGMGHGGVDVRPDNNKTNNGHIRCDGANLMSNMVIENNVFDTSAESVFTISRYDTHGGCFATYYRNTYIQAEGANMFLRKECAAETRFPFDRNARSTLKAYIDERPIVIYK